MSFQFGKKAKLSKWPKKPEKWDKHGHNFIIFSQVSGQTWHHTSAYHLSALEKSYQKIVQHKLALIYHSLYDFPEEKQNNTVHLKEKMARAPKWQLQYNVDFESVIRGHHVYETEIGERLVRKKDDREEATVYDTNGTGIYKELNTDEAHQVTLVGHVPMEISFLMDSFLKSREENTLIAEVTGSRKRENGLVVPCIYHGRSPSHLVAKTLKNEPCKASKLYEVKVPDTPVTKKVCF